MKQPEVIFSNSNSKSSKRGQSPFEHGFSYFLLFNECQPSNSKERCIFFKDQPATHNTFNSFRLFYIKVLFFQ